MIKPTAFKPAWYLTNRHLQTILPNIIHPRFPIAEKERVELADGDFIDLLWSQTRSPHTLLILHGLEGSAHSPYARRILNYCNQHQIAAVLMHFRGCSGEPNRLLRSYHSGETGDVGKIIRYLKTRGITDIALLGYSLGGNVTIKYMGEGNTDPAIRCAIAVSVPFRLELCATSMNQGFAKIYQTSLVNRLIVKMQQKQALFDADSHDYPDPKKMTSFWQFDDNFTAPIHGFDSAEHYYQSASSRQFLPNIDKPTLILHARDDPFMNTEVLPAASELSNSVTLELSDHGGHVGFVTDNGLLPTMWLQKRIHHFLNDQDFLATSSQPGRSSSNI
jgi:predicted alpha/beta-fold hydrolase